MTPVDQIGDGTDANALPSLTDEQRDALARTAATKGRVQAGKEAWAARHPSRARRYEERR